MAAVTGEDTAATVARWCLSHWVCTTSRMFLTQDIRAGVVQGTGWFGSLQHFEFTEPNAAASMYTTAGDYVQLLGALTARRDFLNMILSDVFAVDPQFGVSWGMAGVEQAEAGTYLWQWGNNLGYRAFEMMSVAAGDGFVLMTNGEKGLRLAASLAQSVLPANHGFFRFPLLG
ncbi:hypothetical protein E9531_13345 [Lampropedia puyangensis]|uniref:Beta-lactamase family protein n=1 Tax=Lampropedia puyangensis TaxID=1330072 RepID=A0A4S8EWW5_9BURK|nr:hypothetical protein [Lampropedia puyangensis]THT98780.1 hypothetical protein E9531_13345 [Lampropedia puyangensis]